MTIHLIILDRDGVINFDSPHFIRTPDEWKPIPGSLEAIVALKKAGFTVAVATNQSGIGRGLYTPKTLESIHQEIQSRLSHFNVQLDAIIHCPHHPDAGCSCRKPQPGMILALLKQFEVSPQSALVVGDSLRDLQAGWSAGCRTVLVKTGNGLKTIHELKKLEGHPSFSPLWWKTRPDDPFAFSQLGSFVDFFLKN